MEGHLPGHDPESIPVIWLHDPDDTNYYWERDWVRFLLSGLRVTHHTSVDTRSPPVDNALVILGNDIAKPDVRAYIESYARANCRHGLIHLSDEYFRHDISAYASAAIVFRTCYRPAVPDNTFALGYKQGFWAGYTGPGAIGVTVNDRPYVWAFAGNLDKCDRPQMMLAMRSIKPHIVHRTSFWNSPDCLSTADYRETLLMATFVPSPQGNYSLDCFRTYEALEAGCVPIVMRQTTAQPFNYYKKLFSAMGFGEPIPFPQVNDWKEAAAFVIGARKDATRLEQLRVDCYNWWTRYKEHTKACFTARVRTAFGLTSR